MKCCAFLLLFFITYTAISQSESKQTDFKRIFYTDAIEVFLSIQDQQLSIVSEKQILSAEINNLQGDTLLKLSKPFLQHQFDLQDVTYGDYVLNLKGKQNSHFIRWEYSKPTTPLLKRHL